MKCGAIADLAFVCDIAHDHLGIVSRVHLNSCGSSIRGRGTYRALELLERYHLTVLTLQLLY